MINKSMIRLSNDMTMGELIAIAYPANVFCVANAAAQTAQQEQNAIIFFLFVCCCDNWMWFSVQFKNINNEIRNHVSIK